MDNQLKCIYLEGIFCGDRIAFTILPFIWRDHDKIRGKKSVLVDDDRIEIGIMHAAKTELKSLAWF